MAYTLRLHLGGRAALSQAPQGMPATVSQPWSKELKSAQAEDQIRREEAVQPHRDRQDQDERGAQAPPPDLQAAEDEAQGPWHRHPAEGRRESGQVVHAVSEGLRTWHASSGA